MLSKERKFYIQYAYSNCIFKKMCIYTYAYKHRTLLKEYIRTVNCAERSESLSLDFIFYILGFWLAKSIYSFYDNKK